MTYPPQQPGPYGQQNPWGQQPQGGPFPPQQQPPSQAPPWLSGDPGGFPSFEPEPKKSRGGVIALVVVLALLVLGGGGFGVYMLVNKDDSEQTGGGGGGEGGDDARTVAEKYVEELQKTVNTKIEDVDVSSMQPMTCADDFGRMEKEIGDAQEAVEDATGERPSIEVGMKDFESTEEKGSFTLTQTVNGSDGPDKEMSLAKEDGDWKVCGLYDGASEDPEEPTSAEEPTDEPTGDAPNSGPVPNPIPTT